MIREVVVVGHRGVLGMELTGACDIFHLANTVAAEAGHPSTTKQAAMAKCFATDTAMEVATDAVQVFGGYGYMEDYPIAKFFRDAKILQIYEGTNQVQRIVIARNLVKEAKELEHLEAYIPREVQNSYENEGVRAPAQPA